MKILLATDGSSFGKKTVDFCREVIGKPESAEIKIISVVEPYAPVGAEPFAISAQYYDAVKTEAVKQAKTFVEDAVERFKADFSDASINVSSAVLEGPPARVIVEEARDWKADLIVVGSHGYGFWGRALLGSVSNSVVHHAPCSVLIVRHGE